MVLSPLGRFECWCASIGFLLFDSTDRLYSEVRTFQLSTPIQLTSGIRHIMAQRSLLNVRRPLPHRFRRSSVLNATQPLAYIDEVEKALEYIRHTPDISNEEKKRFFKSANTNLGTSALCLSGGASFGYCGCFHHNLTIYTHAYIVLKITLAS